MSADLAGRAERGERRPRSALREVTTRFALLGTAAVALVAVGAVLMSNALAEHEALRDAETRTEGMARGLAAPFVSQGVREGDPEAVQQLEEVMRARLSEGGITHVVLWDPSGRVMWSDNTEHVGNTYELPETAERAMRDLTAVANLPRDESSHAVDFYPEADQLEVYVGAVGRDGTPFAFEAYYPPDRIAADRQAILPRILGVALGSLLLFAALVVPLVVSLARRMDRVQHERTRAMDLSVASWRHQRRLLAQELHDGVIQDVAALGYGLSILAERNAADPTASTVVRRLQSAASHAEGSLRSLVVDLTPRQLAGEGLASAVRGLADRYRSYGLEVDVHMPDSQDLPEGTGILAFRVLREGMRNVVKHADARHVVLELRRIDEGGLVEIELTDDGTRPLPPGALHSGQGLRLIADTLAEAGGSLTLEPRAEGGTRLRATVPELRAEPGRP